MLQVVAVPWKRGMAFLFLNPHSGAGGLGRIFINGALYSVCAVVKRNGKGEVFPQGGGAFLGPAMSGRREGSVRAWKARILILKG